MLRFVSGVLARIRALTATASREREKEKDTGLVGWLESRRGDSLAVLRWSTTGRGWRLHDWPRGLPTTGIFAKTMTTTIPNPASSSV